MNGSMPLHQLRKFKVTKWVRASQHLSESEQSNVEEVPDFSAADIVSSQFIDSGASDRHMLVLDLDVPAALVPSSTPGHSHLYIQSFMTWPEYEAVLDALASARIVERGYVAASKARKYTAVRLPWVRKK